MLLSACIRSGTAGTPDLTGTTISAQLSMLLRKANLLWLGGIESDMATGWACALQCCFTYRQDA